MAEIYDFNYALYHEDLEFCNEELNGILEYLDQAAALINELDPVLSKSQKMFYIMQKKDFAGNFCRKFRSVGELIENTQLGFGKFCRDFKNFYDDAYEERENIKRQISSKSMTEEDIVALDELFEKRFDYLDIESENFYDELLSYSSTIKTIEKTVHEIHCEHMRGGDFSKAENPFQRGDLRIIK